MDIIKLLVKMGKILGKIGLFVNQKPEPKFSGTQIWYSKYFGLDTVHHFTDLKFLVHEPKSLLARMPELWTPLPIPR